MIQEPKKVREEPTKETKGRSIVSLKDLANSFKVVIIVIIIIIVIVNFVIIIIIVIIIISLTHPIHYIVSLKDLYNELKV